MITLHSKFSRFGGPDGTTEYDAWSRKTACGVDTSVAWLKQGNCIVDVSVFNFRVYEIKKGAKAQHVICADCAGRRDLDALRNVPL